MLGEDSRFGHSYHLFPQIVQVPLIVHFPAMLDARTIDPGAVSSTIDITPTLYAALGYHPLRGSRLMGRPLVGVDDRQSTERRRDTYVIAASYGAVYAALRHNGRRLYIADGIRGGDQAFERDLSGRWSEVEISEGLRAVNQLAIRQHIDEIARTYRVRGT
jgi:arylsulfatase A-like enzyme